MTKEEKEFLIAKINSIKEQAKSVLKDAYATKDPNIKHEKHKLFDQLVLEYGDLEMEFFFNKELYEQDLLEMGRNEKYYHWHQSEYRDGGVIGCIKVKDNMLIVSYRQDSFCNDYPIHELTIPLNENTNRKFKTWFKDKKVYYEVISD